MELNGLEVRSRPEQMSLAGCKLHELKLNWLGHHTLAEHAVVFKLKANVIAELKLVILVIRWHSELPPVNAHKARNREVEFFRECKVDFERSLLFLFHAR